MNYEFTVLNVLVLALLANIVFGVYGLIVKRNLIKKIIALNIASDSVCVLAIYIGYRMPHAIPPVHVLPYSESKVVELVNYSVDPLVQALVLTAIVIGLGFTVYLSIITIRIYELSGSLDIHSLLRMEMHTEEIEEAEEID